MSLITETYLEGLDAYSPSYPSRRPPRTRSPPWWVRPGAAAVTSGCSFTHTTHGGCCRAARCTRACRLHLSPLRPRRQQWRRAADGTKCRWWGLGPGDRADLLPWKPCSRTSPAYSHSICSAPMELVGFSRVGEWFSHLIPTLSHTESVPCPFYISRDKLIWALFCWRESVNRWEKDPQQTYGEESICFSSKLLSCCFFLYSTDFCVYILDFDMKEFHHRGQRSSSFYSNPLVFRGNINFWGESFILCIEISGEEMSICWYIFLTDLCGDLFFLWINVQGKVNQNQASEDE